jgi:hypothetical protein
MHSCDNLTRFNPSSPPPPPRRIRIEKFLSMTVLLFSNNDAVPSGDPSRSGARAHRNQVLWPCKTRKCFVCLFFSACEWAQMMHLAIGSNLCWKSRPDRTQAHWKPDEFGSQCFESTCVLRPHYDNIIHKCQYSLYGYLPTFHIGHVSAVGLAPTIFTKYISCLEVN